MMATVGRFVTYAILLLLLLSLRFLEILVVSLLWVSWSWISEYGTSFESAGVESFIGIGSFPLFRFFLFTAAFLELFEKLG